MSAAVAEAQKRLDVAIADFEAGRVDVDTVRERRSDLCRAQEAAERAVAAAPTVSTEASYRDLVGAAMDATVPPMARAAMERVASPPAPLPPRPKAPPYATTLSLEARQGMAWARHVRGHRFMVGDANLTVGLQPGEIDLAIEGRFEHLDGRTLAELERAFVPGGRGWNIANSARPFDDTQASRLMGQSRWPASGPVERGEILRGQP